MAFSLDQIVPWGRTLNEYKLMFNLAQEDLSGGTLDCGGGPSSFTAEVSAQGFKALSVDPIYVYSPSEIRARFEATAEQILTQVRTTPDRWIWSYHNNPADLYANRRAALERFLADYPGKLAQSRYIAAELPSLPFATESFGLALCSHLLFLYSDRLSADFHRRSLIELCRVAREVRLFPLLTLQGEISPHLETVRSAVESKGWKAEVIAARYELQRDGNQMLRVFRP